MTRTQRNTAVALAREAQALREQATPGPWTAWHTHDGYDYLPSFCLPKNHPNYDSPYTGCCAIMDATLIAHAGTHYAELADAVIALAEEVERLEMETEEERRWQ